MRLCIFKILFFYISFFQPSRLFWPRRLKFTWRWEWRGWCSRRPRPPAWGWRPSTSAAWAENPSSSTHHPPRPPAAPLVLVLAVHQNRPPWYRRPPASAWPTPASGAGSCAADPSSSLGLGTFSFLVGQGPSVGFSLWNFSFVAFWASEGGFVCGGRSSAGGWSSFEYSLPPRIWTVISIILNNKIIRPHRQI